jgi:hypothetical protein
VQTLLLWALKELIPDFENKFRDERTAVLREIGQEIRDDKSSGTGNRARR